MSALYSTITFGASLAVYLSNPVAPSYAPKSGDSTADEVFGVLNAIGGLVFAFGGQVVLLEIQVRLLSWTELLGHAQECACWQAPRAAQGQICCETEPPPDSAPGRHSRPEASPAS